MSQGRWTEEEQNELLSAINRFSNTSQIVEYMIEKTDRSETSILRRLKKIGFTRVEPGKYIASSNLGI